MLRHRALHTREGSVWDTTIRATGVVGALSIPVAVILPDVAPLIGFALVTIWVNGPVSFLFPAVYEPVLIGFGRVYSPVIVATLGVAATLFVEFLNYYLYKRFMQSSGLGSNRIGLRVVELFQRAPFGTVLLCSSVLPYWPLRFVAPVSGYPITRYLFATGLGRFPRLWLFAAFGSVVPIAPWFLVVIALTAFVLALGRWIWRQHAKKT